MIYYGNKLIVGMGKSIDIFLHGFHRSKNIHTCVTNKEYVHAIDPRVYYGNK